MVVTELYVLNVEISSSHFYYFILLEALSEVLLEFKGIDCKSLNGIVGDKPFLLLLFLLYSRALVYLSVVIIHFCRLLQFLVQNQFVVYQKIARHHISHRAITRTRKVITFIDVDAIKNTYSRERAHE